ncbi:MAG: molybdopterin oxidoreductase [Deltaproteobacteria bacterium]|nr:molybdopterin oxidoreductase [Deltaproteobacteria bacterium]
MKSAPQNFSWNRRENIIFSSLAGVGALCFIIGLFVSHERAWASYLVGYFFWLCIALAGVFFTALQHITGSMWSVTVRRVAESFIGYLPVAVVLFVILLFGLHDLYEWTHAEVAVHDPNISQKTAYLNIPFFIIRGLILFALVLGLGGWMVKNSLKQDQTGDAALTARNVRIAAPFLLIFAWAFTFVAFDLMMSLSPHWFSTIFGIYCWAGLFYSGLAMITIWVIMLRKKGILGGFVTEDHLHDLGKLMFAFLVFWAYIGISQYLLIWYGNLPEETFYFIKRTEGGWKAVSIALMLGKFGIPFFLIVGRKAKRNENWLLFMAFWYLAAQWLDVYWMVFPTFFDGPVFGWIEIGTFAGFGGLFFLSVGHFMKKISPVAIRDPRLQEALHHHQ